MSMAIFTANSKQKCFLQFLLSGLLPAAIHSSSSGDLTVSLFSHEPNVREIFFEWLFYIFEVWNAAWLDRRWNYMTLIFPRDFFYRNIFLSVSWSPAALFLCNYCIVLFYCYQQAATAILLQYIRSNNLFFLNDPFKYFGKGESKRTLVTETVSTYFNRKHLIKMCPL